MTTDAARLRRLAATLTDVAGELLQMAAQAEPAPPPALAAELDARSWYKAYVAHIEATRQRSSREDDWRAALAAGLPLTREQMRTLRRELAPPSWQERGRPRLVSAA